MPTHAEKRTLPWTPEQLFDLVADVDRYPEFLPWVLASRITRRENGTFYADLVIGYRLVRETFTSKVTVQRPNRIHVEYLSGPLRYLSNSWSFIREPDGRCTIDFYVDFEFRSRMFQKLVGLFFNEAVRRMVGAFEARAQKIYPSSDNPD